MIRKNRSGQRTHRPCGKELRSWIPAFAGMTANGILSDPRHSRESGNPRETKSCGCIHASGNPLKAVGCGELRATLRNLTIAATITLAGAAFAQNVAGQTPGERWRDCDECPEIVAIPAGTFTMGSPASEAGRYDREGPAHPVTIARPFAIGVYEVTRDEYSRFVQATEHSTGDESCLVNEGHHWEERAGWSWRNVDFHQSMRHPAVCISWDDATAYVSWLSRRTGMDYRLPSAAEWEYAARAGKSTPWYWGDSSEEQCRNANGADRTTDFPWRTPCSDGHARTSLVGSFKANDFGLHDMLGNAWEWVQDCFNWSYDGAPTTGDAWEGGDCSARVMRGASWANTPKYLRAAHRAGERTTFRSDYMGFRVARTM